MSYKIVTMAILVSGCAYHSHYHFPPSIPERVKADTEELPSVITHCRTDLECEAADAWMDVMGFDRHAIVGAKE